MKILAKTVEIDRMISLLLEEARFLVPEPITIKVDPAQGRDRTRGSCKVGLMVTFWPA